MKIYHGLLTILLFQTVHQVCDGWFFSGKSQDESSFVGNAWSKLKAGLSWSATGDVAGETPGFISNTLQYVSKTSFGFMRNAWSTVTSKTEEQPSNGGFFQDKWSYVKDKTSGFMPSLWFASTEKGDRSVSTEKADSSESESESSEITDDDYQSEESSKSENVKTYWSSYTGWFSWFGSKPTPVEECTDEWTSGNVYRLKSELERLLYGQHLVIDHTYSMIEHHWSRPKPDKSLVLSFHGATGVGKNYVAKILVDNMFKLGQQSQFVTTYTGRVDFTEARSVAEYQIRLKNDLIRKVKLCDRHVFIFDEVDMIPVGVMDILNPFLDYNMKVQDRDFRKTVFIFISNMGQKEINEHYMRLWQEGHQRQDVTYEQFEKVLREAVYNDNGGLRHSDIIKAHLIDFYIPFLPLEMQHVKECIKYSFRYNHYIEPTDEDIEAVHKFVDYGPKEHPIFARTGCKATTSKVALVASMRGRRSSREL